MRKNHYAGRAVLFFICAFFAILFLLPTVLTITNSFMSESEIKSNYGMIFETTSGGYVSKTVNLKFIPDKVTMSQYVTGLIRSPEYLVKFWNSVILVVPIVVFQVAIASIAAYSFTRWRGKVRSFIFFFYVILMLMARHPRDPLVDHSARCVRALLRVSAHEVYAAHPVFAH